VQQQCSTLYMWAMPAIYARLSMTVWVIFCLSELLTSFQTFSKSAVNYQYGSWRIKGWGEFVAGLVSTQIVRWSHFLQCVRALTCSPCDSTASCWILQFHKVVQRSFVATLLQSHCWVCQDFENRSTFDEFMIKMVVYFFDTRRCPRCSPHHI